MKKKSYLFKTMQLVVLSWNYSIQKKQKRKERKRKQDRKKKIKFIPVCLQNKLKRKNDKGNKPVIYRYRYSYL